MGGNKNKLVRRNQSHVTINIVQMKLLNTLMQSNQQDDNTEKQIFVGMPFGLSPSCSLRKSAKGRNQLCGACAAKSQICQIHPAN